MPTARRHGASNFIECCGGRGRAANCGTLTPGELAVPVYDQHGVLLRTLASDASWEPRVLDRELRLHGLVHEVRPWVLLVGRGEARVGDDGERLRNVIEDV